MKPFVMKTDEFITYSWDYTTSFLQMDGSTMYVTHEPCVHCRKFIIQAGIKRVVFKNRYRSMMTNEMNGDVEWVHLG